jgi:hypothetical protein
MLGAINNGMDEEKQEKWNWNWNLESETLTVVKVAEKINRAQKVFSSWLASLSIFLPCSFLVTQPNA